jgi:hypothetical protein
VLWATGIECYWCSPEYRHLWCDRGRVDVLQRIVWKPIQDVDVVAHHRATDTCVLVAVGHLTGQHNTGSITRVAYGGMAMTPLGSVWTPASGAGYASYAAVYWLKSPATGAQTVGVSYSGPSSNGMEAMAVTLCLILRRRREPPEPPQARVVQCTSRRLRQLTTWCRDRYRGRGGSVVGDVLRDPLGI